jgi:putative addiction module killer protein
MQATPRTIQIYETDQGETPVLSWLNDLRDQIARVKIKKRLNRVQLGNLGDHRSVGDGVFELRIDFGPGYRIYFAQVGEVIILLLWGGDKSTQDRDILQAKKFWTKYQQDNGN